MNLKEIRDRILYARGEGNRLTDGQAKFPHSHIHGLINEHEKRILRISSLVSPMREATVAIETTTVASAYTAGDATLTVASAANMDRFRWICVSDGTNYERTQIQSISGAVLTISPVLANGYAAGAGSIVNVDNLFLPRDCGRLMLVREWVSPAVLEIRRLSAFTQTYPLRNSQGTPTMVVLTGDCLDRQPAWGTNYAADAGTTTTAITDSALTAASNDYYNDWRVVNVTRTGYARVFDYNASTKVLTLGSTITSQAATDAYFLVPALEQFMVYPLPEADITLRLYYRAKGGALENDYDEPVLPDGFHMLLVYGPLLELAASERGDPLARVNMGDWAHQYNGLLRDLRYDLAPEEGDLPEMARGDAGTYVGP